MQAIAIQGRVECPGCASPVFVTALVPHTICPACQATVDLTPMLQFLRRPFYWHQLLEGRHAPSGKANGVVVEQATPTCPECAVPLELPDPPDGNVSCTCGAEATVRSAPHDGEVAVPRFVGYLLGEDPAALPGATQGDPLRPADGHNPVRFPCPSCDASLEVDGSSRTVKCGYCNSSAYLPDDLWRTLHPVRTARRWYMLVDSARLQPFLRTGRTATRWRVALVVLSCLALFVGPPFGFISELGVVGWIPEMVFAPAALVALLLGLSAEKRLETY